MPAEIRGMLGSFAAIPYLFDGFSTFITFFTPGGAPISMRVFEKEITPPGMDEGGAIDVSTMRNIDSRTKSPKALTNWEKITAQVAYSTSVYLDAQAQIGINIQALITLPDGAQIAVWGWINRFKPNGLKDGDMPLADFEFEISNLDEQGQESLPSYNAGPLTQ